MLNLKNTSNFSSVNLPENCTNILPTKDGKPNPPVYEIASKSCKFPVQKLVFSDKTGEET